MDFVKMLTAQLENQDPLEPMDNQDFTAQMAQFSSLSEAQKTTSLLEQLVASQGTSQINEAVSYIGRQAVVEGNAMEVINGDATVRFDLSAPATVQLKLFDENGYEAKEVQVSIDKIGEQAIDLNDPAYGLTTLDGSYTFSAVVTDSASGASITPLMAGLVTGVVNAGEKGAMLDLNGRQVSLADVRRVELAS
ncbi:putative flagellar hook capping protein [Magnetofaba australis IT-1]|uniref:Basal-body rod modification protein FlgD n=2 Tax=Magnetofaba TaxID=1472292 RepID=A0A1Y2JZN3_9PROT|nr:putative flagellar hook capping protein [Magnetofaba australis IT-1]